MGPAARPLTLLLLWAACAHAVIVPRALDGRGGPRAPLSAARLSRRRALSGAVGAGLSLCALAAAAPAVAAGGAAAGEVATGTAAAGAGANATVGLNAARTGATAAVARSAVRLATYPLDTIKTRQQTLDTTKTQPPAPQTAVQKERWTFDPSLFDGVGWALISAAPAGALLIGTFDTLRAAGLPSLVCSVAAAVPPLAFKVPLERLKQRMQVKRDALRDGDKPSPQSSFDGGGAYCAREILFNAVQLQIFALTYHASGPADALLCGAAASAAAAVLTQPIDVVKTKMMTRAAPGDAETQLQGLDFARDLVRRQGVGALALGIVPRVTHVALGGAAFFAVKATS